MKLVGGGSVINGATPSSFHYDDCTSILSGVYTCLESANSKVSFWAEINFAIMYVAVLFRVNILASLLFSCKLTVTSTN